VIALFDVQVRERAARLEVDLVVDTRLDVARPGDRRLHDPALGGDHLVFGAGGALRRAQLGDREYDRGHADGGEDQQVQGRTAAAAGGLVPVTGGASQARGAGLARLQGGHRSSTVSAATKSPT
jgi:hypothetical protein